MKRPDPWSDPRLRAPTAEEWAAMSPAERTCAEQRILDALDDYREAMAEGTRHSRPKINAYKDLVENVKDYAQRGIAEYFSYDCRSKRLHAWRLASADARTYTPMMPQGGVFPSLVLDLELGVTEGRLRFFKNLAQIPTSEELVGRLQKMTDSFQDQLEEAEQQRKEAVDRLESARTHVIEGILRRLAERDLVLTEQQRAQVRACDDFGRLLRWLELASSAPTVEDILST